MASPFETEGTFLTQQQADHINERSVAGQATLLLLWQIEPIQCNLNCASKSKSDGQRKIQKNKRNELTFMNLLGNLSDKKPS